MPENVAGGVGPGATHGLEAVEAAHVGGGEKLRLHVAENVDEELGVEALHACGDVVGAGARSVIFEFMAV